MKWCGTIAVGALMLALLTLTYPATVASARPVRPMSCCQKMTEPCDEEMPASEHEKPAPLHANSSSCCPGCSLSLTNVAAANAVSFFPLLTKAIAEAPLAAARRSERPPVPPPRCRRS